VRISHLLFADDTIIFCDAVPEQLLHIRMILSCFEAVIGLLVNLSKSEMVPVGKVDNMSSLADLLCCRTGVLPMMYLGMPLGASYKVLPVWNSILEKIERCLARRYSCQIWDGVGGWRTKPYRGSHVCGLWKSISLVWEAFMEQIEFVGGVGNRIRFWYDRWCGVTPLKDLFPLLFTCSTNRNVSIDSVLVRPGLSSSGEWHISFVRDFNDWEIYVVVSFFQFLHPLLSSRERQDIMVWKLCKNGQFDVRSFYSALRGSNRRRFPWKGIRGVKAPRRASFFIWTVKGAYFGWLVSHVQEQLGDRRPSSFTL
jgi:hypothetical protein